MKKIVALSLGANICSKDGTFNILAIRSITKQVKTMVVKRKYGIALVVGLGGAARSAINTSSKYATRIEMDEIKINVTQINAALLIAALRKQGVRVIPRVLTRLDDTKEIKNCAGVFGGVRPGLTSDASAALISNRLHSPLIIVSTVGAIFENDPAQTKSIHLKSVDSGYIKQLLKQGKQSHVLDEETCKILLKMPEGSVVKISGPENIVDVLEGSSKDGTSIFL